MIKYLDVKAHPGGYSKLTIVADTPPEAFSEILRAINSGKHYVCEIKPYRKPKSNDQLAAIWGKIHEIAAAIGSSNEEVYLELLRRYGKPLNARIEQKDLKDYEREYRIVDIKQFREDGTVFVVLYKGLSKMDTKEATVLLDGILSECTEMGLNSEVSA